MYKIGQYNKEDKLSNLICDNYQMLLVLSRFGIPLGIGEKSIGEVCRENNVDADTFLSVVNLLLDEDNETTADASRISVNAVVSYLKNSHSYFLNFRLPQIKENLTDAISEIQNEANPVIIKYFDEYYNEVKKHMQYEEANVFPYIESLTSGTATSEYKISIFSQQHDHVEEKLAELKNIIIKYYTANSNKLNCVLFDIFSCSKDLASHNEIEDKLLVPAISILEKKI